MPFQSPTRFFGTTPKVKNKPQPFGYRPMVMNVDSTHINCCGEEASGPCCAPVVNDARPAFAQVRLLGRSNLFHTAP